MIIKIVKHKKWNKNKEPLKLFLDEQTGINLIVM